MHSNILDNMETEHDHEFNSQILVNKDLINRNFLYNSVEEIFASLRRETHPFAKLILQRMEANSLQSMKVALKMIRKATNMCYGDTLKMEQNVAFNMMNDPELEIGVKKVLGVPYFKAEKTPEGNRLNPGFASSISDQKVDSFFAENPMSAKFPLKVVENALLPTREYFRLFPDSMRIYLNETLSYNHDMRRAIDLEIKELLREEGIDFRNKTITVPYLREVIMKKINMNRHLLERARRT